MKRSILSMNSEWNDRHCSEPEGISQFHCCEGCRNLELCNCNSQLCRLCDNYCGYVRWCLVSYGLGFNCVKSTLPLHCSQAHRPTINYY